MREPASSPLERIKLAIQRFLDSRREPPEDPYAYVTAPRKPRPAGRSAAAVIELDAEKEPDR